MVLLVVPATASTQICVPFVACPLPGGLKFPCASDITTLDLAPGDHCAPPDDLQDVVGLCGDTIPGGLFVWCCSCVTPFPGLCRATLIDSNTVLVLVQSPRGLESIEPTLVNATASIFGFEPGTQNTV